MSIVLDGTTGITTPGLTNTGTETIVNLTTTGNTILGDASTDTLNVGNGGLVKNASGNVGIGTSSPGYRLDVRGGNARIAANASGASDGVLYFGNAATNYIFGGDGNNYMTFGVNNAERMRIDSAGNVFIGTTSNGGGRLGVAADGETLRFTPGSGTSSTASTFGTFRSNAGIFYVGLDSSTGSSFSAPNAAVLWHSGSPMIFATSNAERMRIDSSGNLAVGRSSALDNYLVTFEKGSDKNLILNSTTSGNGVYTTMAFANQSAAKAFLYWYSTDSRFYVQNGTGGVYLAQNGTTWTSASDERFKTSLVPIEDAVNKVSALRAVTGRFLEDEENVSRAFLIAQDVQAVFPQAVDADDPEKLGVRYTDTIPLLVAAIKEQQAIITQLQADVATLKGTA